jgi:peptidoglycan/xylan/chitin deacetylase (PgdA/CDA1 family)
VIGLLFLWSVIVVLGVYFIQFNFFLRAKNEIISENAVALTFDDGPHPIHTPATLAILKEKGATATFFLIGKNIEGNEHVVRQIVADGHAIGNHSFTHDNFSPLWSAKKLTADIAQNQDLLQTFTTNKIHYRPPFGVTNPTIAKAVTQLNLSAVGWSLRSYDTVAKNSEMLLKKILENIKPKDIILLHEAAPHTTATLAKLIDGIKAKGYTLTKIE